MRLCTCKIVHKHKKAFFIAKVKSRCFCWFSAAILVSHVGTRTRRLHTKLKKKLRGTFWKITKNGAQHRPETCTLMSILYHFNFLASSVERFKIYFFIVWQWKHSTERFYMKSSPPYWYLKTMKRRPCWCSKPVLWELNHFLTKMYGKPSFGQVSGNALLVIASVR